MWGQSRDVVGVWECWLPNLRAFPLQFLRPTCVQFTLHIVTAHTPRNVPWVCLAVWWVGELGGQPAPRVIYDRRFGSETPRLFLEYFPRNIPSFSKKYYRTILGSQKNVIGPSSLLYPVFVVNSPDLIEDRLTRKISVLRYPLAIQTWWSPLVEDWHMP